MKVGKVIGGDRVYESRFDGITAGRDPFIKFVGKGSEFLVNNSVVCGLYVLATRHHDGLERSLVSGIMALLKTLEADFPIFGVIVGVVTTVFEESVESINSFTKKLEVSIFEGGEVSESVRQSVVIVGTTDTVMD